MTQEERQKARRRARDEVARRGDGENKVGEVEGMRREEEKDKRKILGQLI